jgi:hypothetical protein
MLYSSVSDPYSDPIRIKGFEEEDEAFSPQKRTSSTINMKCLNFSTFIGHFCSSGFGSGSNTDPDPIQIRIRNIGNSFFALTCADILSTMQLSTVQLPGSAVRTAPESGSATASITRAALTHRHFPNIFNPGGGYI